MDQRALFMGIYHTPVSAQGMVAGDLPAQVGTGKKQRPGVVRSVRMLKKKKKKTSPAGAEAVSARSPPACVVPPTVGRRVQSPKLLRRLKKASSPRWRQRAGSHGSAKCWSRFFGGNFGCTHSLREGDTRNAARAVPARLPEEGH